MKSFLALLQKPGTTAETYALRPKNGVLYVIEVVDSESDLSLCN